MANVRGREKFDGKSLLFVEFEPPSAWTEDPSSHYLLVDLPDFKMEEVKLQVNNEDQIIVSGERKVTENKYVRFEQKFHVPANSDIENISGKFEGEFLYVTVPKKKVHEEGENIGTEDGLRRENASSGEAPNEDERLSSEAESKNEKEKWSIGGNLVVTSVLEKLRRRKGIILTAVLAFSLGVFVSHKLHSNENCEIPNSNI